MSRRVITTNLQAAGTGASVDGYFDKLFKYIPADIVGAWLFASGAIKAASGVPATTLLWIVFAVLLAFTPIWIWQWTKKPGEPTATTQIVISTIAFAVWIFALGGPFARLGFYHPIYGSLLLVFYSLVVAMINPRDHQGAARAAAGTAAG